MIIKILLAEFTVLVKNPYFNVKLILYPGPYTLNARS